MGCHALLGLLQAFLLQAKESWEMDTKEKLEQAAIVKEKGTMYFKVCKLGDGGGGAREIEINWG